MSHGSTSDSSHSAELPPQRQTLGHRPEFAAPTFSKRILLLPVAMIFSSSWHHLYMALIALGGLLYGVGWGFEFPIFRRSGMIVGGLPLIMIAVVFPVSAVLLLLAIGIVTWWRRCRRRCPNCGKRLRTAKARQCFECGSDWHEPELRG